ncbi:CHAT domain-containing protein [Streptomyces sp. NBC_01550]|uniref:CHAT domain-containing protein n=1 Tax=Streptomyces sp. NBC_01550 TaxID=2975875 RepID=UPI00387064EB
MRSDPIEEAFHSNDPTYVGAVVEALRQHAASLSPGDPQCVVLLSNLAALMHRLSDLTNRTDVLQETIRIQRWLVARDSSGIDVANRVNLGRSLTTWHEMTGDPAFLNEAVRVLREAAERAADRDGAQTALSNLGSALTSRYLATDETADIRDAVEAFRRVMLATADGHPMLPVRLLGFADALRHWFEATREGRLLPEAIAVHRRLDATISERHHDRARIKSNLASLLSAKAGLDSDVELCKEAVERGREVVELTPDDSPMRALRLSNVAGALATLGELSSDGTFLAEATDLLREVTESAPDGSELHCSSLIALGRCLAKTASLGPGDAELGEAIAVLRRAVDLTGEGGPLRPAALAELAAALRQGKHSTAAMEVYSEAADVASVDERRAGLLTGQAASLLAMYKTSQDVRTLDEAIAVCRRALRIAPADVQLQANLASALIKRPSQHEADIAEAGALSAEVVRHTPTDHERYLLRLSFLGRVLVPWVAFPDSGLERPKAIAVFRRAMEVLPAEQLRELVSLPFLDKAYLAAFQAYGDRRLLAEAIHIGRALVSRALPDDLTLPTDLSNLATSLTHYAVLTEDTSSLAESATLYERALVLLPPDSENRPMLQTNLVGLLTRLLQHGGDPSRLDDAVDSLRDTLATVPADHPDRREWLVNLAAALSERASLHREALAAMDSEIIFLRRALSRPRVSGPEPSEPREALAAATAARDASRQQWSASLAQAIEIHHQICRESPGTGTGHWINFGNLATAYWDKYTLAGDRSALDEAILLFRRSLDGLGNTHPYRAGILINLGRALRDAADAYDTRETLADSVAVYREAASITAAPARIRADAAAWWGYGAQRLGDLRGAQEGLALAVSLLDEVAWRGLSRSDQERVLTDYGTLAADAAAVAIELGDPERAVELLEQGRGVLLAQGLELRTDYDRLHARSPELAIELARIQDELDLAAHTAFTTGAEPREDVRETLTRRREQLLPEVRALEGFHDFLRAPTFADLQEASGHGPVIVINVSQFRCDALVITTDGLHHRPLPGLSQESADDVAGMLLSTLELDRQLTGSGDDPVEAILKKVVYKTLDWIHERITDPILSDLGLGALLDSSTWPRVWWCPTGKLAFLPLHAAGYVPGEQTASTAVLDRVVSSYTPTVRALLYARRPPGDGHSTEVQPLIVALPETPGQPGLPAAMAELRNLQSRYPTATALTGAKATATSVVTELQNHAWVHFACHASQDARRASAGQLHLYDGALTAGQIGRLRIAHGEFAFLAACQTSQASTHLTDESLTLASAMLLAGYRRVVGTLWSIPDSLLPYVSRRVYSALEHDGVADAANAATALHSAVRALRDRHPHSPLHWAPYVHVGP